MKKDPYKLDPSRSPLLPNSGYRRSGLLMAGLAAAIFVIVGYVWSTQHGTHVAQNPTTAPLTATTSGAGTR